MKKLVWIGPPFFAPCLKDCGWDYVYFHNPAQYEIFSWDRLISLAGFEPEVLVVADGSLPPTVLGIENFPCLTVWYSVDSHIHSWHRYYAQAYDFCLVSLKDNIDMFKTSFLPGSRIWWSPPFASHVNMPATENKKIFDCLFVGTHNPDLSPKRHKFFMELRKMMPSFKIKTGDFTQLFPLGRVLINQVERNDLNFRVFEALGCGSALVTPRIGHGLQDIFVDGEHLLLYTAHDSADAYAKIIQLLDNPGLRNEMARAGNSEVRARHMAINRAQEFSNKINEVIKTKKTFISSRQKKQKIILEQYLTLPYLFFAKALEGHTIKKSFLAAAKGNFGLKGIDS